MKKAPKGAFFLTESLTGQIVKRITNPKRPHTHDTNSPCGDDVAIHIGTRRDRTDNHNPIEDIGAFRGGGFTGKGDRTNAQQADGEHRGIEGGKQDIAPHSDGGDDGKKVHETIDHEIVEAKDGGGDVHDSGEIDSHGRSPLLI